MVSPQLAKKKGVIKKRAMADGNEDKAKRAKAAADEAQAMMPPVHAVWTYGAAYSVDPLAFTALPSKTFQAAMIDAMLVMMENQKHLSDYLVNQANHTYKQSKTLNAKLTKALMVPFVLTDPIRTELHSAMKCLMIELYNEGFEKCTEISSNDRTLPDRVWLPSRPNPVKSDWPVRETF
jgi:hypothetical protein